MDRKRIQGGGIRGSLQRTTVGGMPFFLTEFNGPGRVSFSRDGVGELRALQLRPDELLDVGEGSLVCAAAGIGYEGIYVPGTGGRLGLWMDRLRGPGEVIVHAYGNLVTLDLDPGDQVVCEKRSILHKAPSMKLTAFVQKVGGGPLGWAMSQEMYLVEGPGRVALQTGR